MLEFYSYETVNSVPAPPDPDTVFPHRHQIDHIGLFPDSVVISTSSHNARKCPLGQSRHSTAIIMRNALGLTNIANRKVPLKSADLIRVFGS
jgi:hypothetical protein